MKLGANVFMTVIVIYFQGEKTIFRTKKSLRVFDGRVIIV